MSTRISLSTLEGRRLLVLWVCIALFLLRVVGQIEALLLSPDWLPPMEAWYSGLLPYPLLLPAQIILLMFMTALVIRQMSLGPDRSGARQRRWIRGFAIIYFDVMLVRIGLHVFRGAENVIAAGGIPVAFHWVLALFLLVLAREPADPATGGERTST